jgi:hypothetical protein
MATLKHMLGARGSACPATWTKGRRRRPAPVCASLDALDKQSQQLQRYSSFPLYGKHVRHERQEAAKLYFREVMSNGCLDLLDFIVVDGVTYAEKNIYDEEFTGRQRLRRILAEYQQAYPAMRYDVVSSLLCCCSVGAVSGTLPAPPHAHRPYSAPRLDTGAHLLTA